MGVTSAPNSTRPQSRLYPDIFDRMHQFLDRRLGRRSIRCTFSWPCKKKHFLIYPSMYEIKKKKFVLKMQLYTDYFWFLHIFQLRRVIFHNLLMNSRLTAGRVKNIFLFILAIVKSRKVLISFWKPLNRHRFWFLLLLGIWRVLFLYLWKSNMEIV